jgi:hypothetical protein
MDIAKIIFEGATYDFFKFLVGPLIVTVLATTVLKKAFHKLDELKETLYFAIGVFGAVCILFYSIGSSENKPTLVGTLQGVNYGPWRDGHDTVAVLEVAIINSGSMQTVAKTWDAEALIGGVKYQANLVSMPESTFTFNFNNLPGSSITYHAEDQIAQKTNPVQQGGLLSGILFVVFPGVQSSTFRGGAYFTVTFEDVFSRKYTATAAVTAQEATRISTTPGLHTQMVCPAPAELLQSLKPKP